MSATNNIFYPRVAGNAVSKSLAVSSTAVAPDAPTDLEQRVHFTVADAGVVWLYDGQTPTASFGHVLPEYYSDTVHAATWAKSKFIREDSTDARIQYTPVA